MLYPQIVNLALKDSQSNQKTRYDKLNVIIKHIEKQYGVGTVDSPKEYFKGVLPMRWGPYGFVPPGESNNFIYFGGKTTSGTILGLGGSIHHLIGEQRGESNPHSHSGTYAIVSRLSKELDLPMDSSTDQIVREDRMLSSFNRSELENFDSDSVRLATEQMEGPIQNLEFLAKKLLEVKVGGTHVVLGTPIYVALAE